MGKGPSSVGLSVCWSPPSTEDRESKMLKTKCAAMTLLSYSPSLGFFRRLGKTFSPWFLPYLVFPSLRRGQNVSPHIPIRGLGQHLSRKSCL